MGCCTEAHGALDHLYGSILTLPKTPACLLMYIRKQAMRLRQIEWKQSSLDDLLAVEAANLTAGIRRDIEEVFSFVQAMDTIIALLERLPISDRLIGELHLERLSGLHGVSCAQGELRDHLLRIGNMRCFVSTACTVPPPPGRVPDLVPALERFVHEMDDLPDPIRNGLKNVQFETIHPFGDGNCRVGLLLIAIQLCNMQPLDQQVLNLSHVFRAHRPEYCRRLSMCRTKDNFMGCLRSFPQWVIASGSDHAETGRRIVLLRGAGRALLLIDFWRIAGSGLRRLVALHDHLNRRHPGFARDCRGQRGHGKGAARPFLRIRVAGGTDRVRQQPTFSALPLHGLVPVRKTENRLGCLLTTSTQRAQCRLAINPYNLPIASQDTDTLQAVAQALSRPPPGGKPQCLRRLIAG